MSISPKKAGVTTKPNALQNIKNLPLSSVLNINKDGNLEEKCGVIYMTDANDILQEVYYTDSMDNLAHIVRSTKEDDIGIGQPLEKASS